jgi:hypothetical protein
MTSITHLSVECVIRERRKSLHHMQSTGVAMLAKAGPLSSSYLDYSESEKIYLADIAVPQ